MRKKNHWISAILLPVLGVGLLAVPPTEAATETRPIIFPMLGTANYRDDFGDPRSGGRTHEGNDIFAPKMRPLVAVVSGTIRSAPYPQPSYGYAVFITDADGYRYWYLHLNNDTPGTDNGRGGGYFAYAPDIQEGLPVTAGQLIGWVGDSGNAESTSPHLHFEIHRPDGTPISPYNSLRAAPHITRPVAPPPLADEILPLGQFKGGASIALHTLPAETEGIDLPQGLVVGAGPGGTPYVRTMDMAGISRGNFFAYEQSFFGGVQVAVGDIDGDDIDEIITAPGHGRQALIRIFSLAGEKKSEFLAYPGFTLGLRLSVADLDGNGADEIITGPQAGGQARVRVFHGDGSLVNEFFAYSPSFRGGIEVVATPATPESPAMIVTAPSSNAAPKVRLWQTDGTFIREFLAYRDMFRGGVRLAIGELEAESFGPEILTAPASQAGPDFRIYSLEKMLLGNYDAFESWWRGGYSLAINGGQAVVVSGLGGRRASVRKLLVQPDTI